MLLTKKVILLILTFLSIVIVFFFHRIPQSLAYHQFADRRTFFDISNGLNVLSNFPFLFIGAWGLTQAWQKEKEAGMLLIYTPLFLGIFLIGIGSAWYHSNPDNDTLVWDRLPMVVVFMSLLAWIIAQFIGYRLGVRLLIPLVLVGVGSVLYWHYTELQGQGDLRPYGWVQFYPMLFIPLIMGMYYLPAHRRMIRPLICMVIFYAVAKVLEIEDQPIFEATGFVSGHTLKHLAAAASTACLLWLI